MEFQDASPPVVFRIKPGEKEQLEMLKSYRT